MKKKYSNNAFYENSGELKLSASEKEKIRLKQLAKKLEKRDLNKKKVHIPEINAHILIPNNKSAKKAKEEYLKKINL